MSKNKSKENENANGLATVSNEKGLVLGSESSPFESPQNRIMNIPGMPRQWRSDCSSNGGYKIGETGKAQDELEMEILFYQDLPQTELFADQYGVTDWIVAYFIDSENQFSTCLFKGRSRENFIEMFRSVAGQGLSLPSVKVTAIMKDKESEIKKGGENIKARFKICDFKFKPNSVERVTELQDFWLANNGYEGLYSNFVGDILSKARVVKGVVVQEGKVEDSIQEAVTV